VLPLKSFDARADDEAVEAELKRQASFGAQTVGPLRAAYKESGVRGFWMKQIKMVKEQKDAVPGLGYEIARRYALMGDTEQALAYIEKHMPERGSGWAFLKVDPIFDSIRSNPRFQEALRKLNL
jgi:hypothetical protein